MGALLSFAGQNGPVMLFVGVFIGLLLPSLAEQARPLMGATVFVVTLGAFLNVDRAAFRAQATRPRRLVATLLWTAVGVPLVTWALVRLLPLPAWIESGMLLCMLAPPVGSAAAIAAMLALNPALALISTVIVSLACPIILPKMALLLGGIALHFDAWSLMARLALVVLGAAAAALALRWLAPDVVRRNPQAMTGISVLGLIVGAIGAMHGMRPQLSQHGWQVAQALAAAFAINAGFQVLGSLVFARLGRIDAMTVGLASGNRNVTLVWVAAAPWLVNTPQVEVYLAASVFPIFILPLLTARWLRRRPVRAPGPDAAAAAAAGAVAGAVADGATAALVPRPDRQGAVRVPSPPRAPRRS